MNLKNEKYHPNLFQRTEDYKEDTDQPTIIPQTSLYDIPVQYQAETKQKHVTVFGFSQCNRNAVLEQIKQLVVIDKKEEGKNYINVWSEDIASLEKLISLHQKSINGEIIGVFRKNFGALEDEEIYVKKKGVFQIIYEYFFGE